MCVLYVNKIFCCILLAISLGACSWMRYVRFGLRRISCVQKLNRLRNIPYPGYRGVIGLFTLGCPYTETTVLVTFMRCVPGTQVHIFHGLSISFGVFGFFFGFLGGGRKTILEFILDNDMPKQTLSRLVDDQGTWKLGIFCHVGVIRSRF